MHRRIRAALAAVGALVALAAFAGTAGAATVSNGHYDIEVEVDCANTELALHLHDHTGGGATLAGTVFEVSATGSSGDDSILNEQSSRVLTEAGSYRLGFDVEYDGGCSPAVSIERSGAATVPSGGKAAGYLPAYAPVTFVDTRSWFLWNLGFPVSMFGHTDLRWALTDISGTYEVPLEASASGYTAGTGTVTFEVP